MTKDEIIRMAREAGLPMAWISDSGVLNWTDLKAFADLIAAHKAEVITAEAYRCGHEVAAELRRLHEANQELLEALEKLARLGNGERYGNSEGNVIARAAVIKGRNQT